MAQFAVLVSFTEQGAKALGDTLSRSAAFRRSAAKLGVKVRDQFWSLGTYDGLLICDAPSAEAMAAALVGLARLGNVRTQTLELFGAPEMKRILAKGSAGTAR